MVVLEIERRERKGNDVLKKIYSKMALIFLALIFTLSYIPTKAETLETKISKTAYNACVEYGEKYGICPELLMAIIERESGGNSEAENGDCKGLMQISKRWHRDRMKNLGVSDLFDEKGNILVGADYLSELFEEYGEAALVLDIYNGNSMAERNYEDGILSNYASGILDRSAKLEVFHGK